MYTHALNPIYPLLFILLLQKCSIVLIDRSEEQSGWSQRPLLICVCLIIKSTIWWKTGALFRIFNDRQVLKGEEGKVANSNFAPAWFFPRKKGGKSCVSRGEKMRGGARNECTHTRRGDRDNSKIGKTRHACKAIRKKTTDWDEFLLISLS